MTMQMHKKALERWGYFMACRLGAADEKVWPGPQSRLRGRNKPRDLSPTQTSFQTASNARATIVGGWSIIRHRSKSLTLKTFSSARKSLASFICIISSYSRSLPLNASMLYAFTLVSWFPFTRWCISIRYVCLLFVCLLCLFVRQSCHPQKFWITERKIKMYQLNL